MTSINDLTDPHSERLSALTDAELISELVALAALPDESDERWDQEPFDLFDEAGLLVALADQVGERRLVQGIGLVLDKACLGDPGEMMRGLRHTLEAACDGDWEALADICADRSRSVRAGTRLWATREVAILRDPRLIDVIRERLCDEESLVRHEAVRAAEMFAQQHSRAAQMLVPDLVTMAGSDADPDLRREADEAVVAISQSEA